MRCYVAVCLKRAALCEHDIMEPFAQAAHRTRAKQRRRPKMDNELHANGEHRSWQCEWDAHTVLLLAKRKEQETRPEMGRGGTSDRRTKQQTKYMTNMDTINFIYNIGQQAKLWWCIHCVWPVDDKGKRKGYLRREYCVQHTRTRQQVNHTSFT